MRRKRSSVAHEPTGEAARPSTTSSAFRDMSLLAIPINEARRLISSTAARPQ